MKKILRIVLIMTMTLLVVVGCGEKVVDKPVEKVVEKPEVKGKDETKTTEKEEEKQESQEDITTIDFIDNNWEKRLFNDRPLRYSCYK